MKTGTQFSQRVTKTPKQTQVAKQSSSSVDNLDRYTSGEPRAFSKLKTSFRSALSKVSQKASDIVNSDPVFKVGEAIGAVVGPALFFGTPGLGALLAGFGVSESFKEDSLGALLPYTAGALLNAVGSVALFAGVGAAAPFLAGAALCGSLGTYLIVGKTHSR